MSTHTTAEWRKLPTSLTELCINTTLRCGQSFRWRKSGHDEWSCALHGRLLTLKQDSTHLHYRALFPHPSRPAGLKKRFVSDLPTPPPSSPASVISALGVSEDAQTDLEEDGNVDLLTHYLNLKPSLSNLYAKWSAKDANFRRRVSADMQNLQGIRVLKQDPWEALCGFICSSNNNIKRISLMMNRLCTHYGRFIGELEEEVIDLDAEQFTEGKSPRPSSTQDSKRDVKPPTKTIKIPYHDFPPPTALTGPDVEATLRQLGFGYRAKYIYQTACIVANEKGGIQWLESLMNPDARDDATSSTTKGDKAFPPSGREGYRYAHEQLLQLTGVGPKVADCVCLMGLGWGEAVPVDTHVWQIAVRDYRFGGKNKNVSMTKALYDAIGDKFRQLWGTEAGWAHSVLFTADLSDFKKVVKVEAREKVIDEEGTVMVKEEEVDEEGLGVHVDTAVPGEKGRGKRRKNVEQLKTEMVVERLTKRPLDGGEKNVVEVDMMSRVKRRRRGQK